MSANSYSLPVSVPVIGTYNDSSMLQSSPQMAHNSISPRPSSSETDSVYPSGGLLEMSNGYPHSASPLGGSPSPGPSPGIGTQQQNHHQQQQHQHQHQHQHHHNQQHNSNNNNNHNHNKLQHQSLKQNSPGSSSARSSNLRVVIPTPMNPSMGNDDLSYVEHSRQQANLNTPVVALQTPIPGLSNYTTTLGSFGAQDFSINSDLSMIASWGAAAANNAHAAQNAMNSLGQHSRIFFSSGLPHLAVSNSTPPPSTSPLSSVKIKAEPISPPREHHSSSSHQQHQQNQHQQQQQHHHHSNLSGGGGTNGQQHNNQLTVTSMASVIGGGHSSSNSGSMGNSLNSHSHLIHSRPSSTGHLTPTPGSPLFAGSVTPTNAPSPVDIRHINVGGGNSSHLPDYDSPVSSNSASAHKRPRISEGWAT